MPTFPLPLIQLFGQGGAYLIYLAIGIAFGAVLEVSGFANSPKLAAQFYFKDMTVIKVMFGAIVVAMLLILLASGIGLLDYNLVWVNPTYMWPGIVGGLIMGIGFILGGFCPGTSLVAAATLKIDGMFFVLGAFFGIFMFGETVSLFDDFWYSSYMGRFTLQDLFQVDPGVVALVVVLMALFVFWGSEQLERIFGKKDLKIEPRWRYGAAGIIVLLGITLVVMGQPTTEDKWARMQTERETQLANRAVQIDPGELFDLMRNDRLKVVMLDVRSEADFNRFHILDARHILPADVPAALTDFHMEQENTVFVVMSNDEAAATEVWKLLVAESIPNSYILGGGVNAWLDKFSSDDFKTQYALAANIQPVDDQLRYSFPESLGARYPVAAPDPGLFHELEYESKVVLEIKRGPTGGGCG
ncbi:MAG: YeeE/YedE family protein [Anaerolineaceae bacterium]|nr:YeeE/YedE family protein [Anaerolineaceae bacterium]